MLRYRIQFRPSPQKDHFFTAMVRPKLSNSRWSRFPLLYTTVLRQTYLGFQPGPCAALPWAIIFTSNTFCAPVPVPRSVSFQSRALPSIPYFLGCYTKLPRPSSSLPGPLDRSPLCRRSLVRMFVRYTHYSRHFHENGLFEHSMPSSPLPGTRTRLSVEKI